MVKKIKILIAEDDKTTRVFYNKALNDAIFEKRFEDDGEKALKAYKIWNPDILILDHMMPGLSGYSVLKQIREVERDQRVVVFIATSIRKEEDIVAFLKLGVQDYLVKPIDFRTLGDRILDCWRSKLAKKESASGKRVLVVDDSGVVRAFLLKILKEMGAKTEQAEDGQHAVERHKSFRPHLTIMDLVMPNLGGMDAIETIREFDPEAKFLVLTSSTRRDEVIKAKKLGVISYILKPPKTDIVIEQVRKVFEKLDL